MGKIWDSLRYGNAKTKRTIVSVIGLFVLTIVCIVMAITTASIIWVLVGVFSAILALIIVQSVSFKSGGKLTPVQSKPLKAATPKEKPDKTERKPWESPSKEADTDEGDKGFDRSYISELKQSDIKRIMVSYKVRKDHLPIMIDSWEDENVKQCPAYIWVTRGSVFYLIFEKKPKRIKVDKSKIGHMTYHPGVQAARDQEYQEYRKPSFAALTFGSLVPTYYEESERGKVAYKKNLYQVDPGVMITNTSVRSVMKILKLDVVIEDKVTKSERHSSYYKEAYKINILWKDGVYTTAEFKTKIKEMLQNMAEANISTQVFNDNLRQLIAGRMITKEYAEYYMDIRKKTNTKSNNKKGK